MIHTRHLLMHVYPVRGNGVWQWNLDQILARLHLFNGFITIEVALDETTDRLKDVLAYFSRDGATANWLAFANDPSLREVVTHKDLWLGVPHEPGHATFYCHAKGVTHPLESAYNAWTKLLYEANLDYWPWAEEVLAIHPIAGSLLKTMPWGVEPVCPWHYSGAFYWIRNEALVGRDWRKIDRQFWGVETWPSRLFTLDEAGVLFFRGGDYNMADWGFLNRINAEWMEWKTTHQDYRSAGPSLTTSPLPS